MGNSKYIEQWKNLMLQASEALGQNKFADYENLMMQVNNAYDNYKNDMSLQYECKNFGISNYIFEDVLPSLFVSKPQLMKEWLEIVKEDKNLLLQFQFYKALENCQSREDVKEYISESLEILKEGIDTKSLSRSNAKLNKFIHEHELKPSMHISDEMLQLFESCDFLFKNKKTLTNLNEMNKHLKIVMEYVSNNVKLTINENKISSLLEKIETSDTLLNEEERGIVMDILDCRAKDGDVKKRKLYDKFKNECIKAIDKMLAESSQEDKEGLLSIKEQLKSQEFCAETLVADIAKLLEIRDILLSE